MLLLEERLILLGEEVKKGNMTWKEVADRLNKEFGENLSKDAVRKRFYVRDRRNGGEELNTEISGAGEYETVYLLPGTGYIYRRLGHDSGRCGGQLDGGLGK